MVIKEHGSSELRQLLLRAVHWPLVFRGNARRLFESIDTVDQFLKMDLESYRALGMLDEQQFFLLGTWKNLYGAMVSLSGTQLKETPLSELLGVHLSDRSLCERVYGVTFESLKVTCGQLIDGPPSRGERAPQRLRRQVRSILSRHLQDINVKDAGTATSAKTVALSDDKVSTAAHSSALKLSQMSIPLNEERGSLAEALDTSDAEDEATRNGRLRKRKSEAIKKLFETLRQFSEEQLKYSISRVPIDDEVKNILFKQGILSFRDLRDALVIESTLPGLSARNISEFTEKAGVADGHDDTLVAESRRTARQSTSIAGWEGLNSVKQLRWNGFPRVSIRPIEPQQLNRLTRTFESMELVVRPVDAAAYAKFLSELMSKSSGELEGLRLNRKQQRFLVRLVAEQGSDDQASRLILNNVEELVRHHARFMSPRQLVVIFDRFSESEAVSQSVIARCRNLSGSGMPKILLLLREASLRYEDLRSRFTFVLSQVVKSGEPLARIGRWLGLPSGSHAFPSIVDSVVRVTPFEKVVEAFDLWLSDVVSSKMHRKIKVAILHRTFECLDDVKRRASWVGMAHSFCGGWPDQRPGPWSELPQGASRLAQQFRLTSEFERFLISSDGDAARFRFWQRWLPNVRSFHKFDRLGAFMIQIGDRYIVEFSGKAKGAIHSYSIEEWAQVNARRDVSLLDLKKQGHNESGHWFAHRGNWERRVNNYLAQRIKYEIPAERHENLPRWARGTPVS